MTISYLLFYNIHSVVSLDWRTVFLAVLLVSKKGLQRVILCIIPQVFWLDSSILLDYCDFVVIK